MILDREENEEQPLGEQRDREKYEGQEDFENEGEQTKTS